MKKWILFSALLVGLPQVGVAKPETWPFQESLRPQFHFTADEGWLNDPNGLVYVDGVYHLFFQHDKKDKCWGHAISTDLLHWEQLPDAITAEKGPPVYSGSAVVDHKNTSGFQSGKNPPVVAAFTSWGEGQCLAYSNDDGMTWTRYEGNPVLKMEGDQHRSFPLSSRDPHVMWDDRHERWVMVLYTNPKQLKSKEGSGFSFYTSPDLKQWKQQSHLAGFYVCPDVFQLPIEGTDESAWVAMDWSTYTTGVFDGTMFVPNAEIKKLDAGKNLSANQSWKHLPDGRVIQMCWLRGGKYPGMPFSQQMSFPTELSLRRIGQELILCKNPIREFSRLHGNTEPLGLTVLSEGEVTELPKMSQSLDLDLSFSLEEGGEMGLQVLGQDIRVSRERIQCMGHEGKLPGAPENQSLRILLDRTSLEIFANDGSLTMAFCLIPQTTDNQIMVTVMKGQVNFEKAVVNEVESIWK